MANKRLITEACVRKLAPGATLRIGGDAIATPAALDLAFQRGIAVVYGDDPAPKAGRDQGLAAALGSDGSYVVTVKDGAFVAHRMTKDGPLEIARGTL